MNIFLASLGTLFLALDAVNAATSSWTSDGGQGGPLTHTMTHDSSLGGRRLEGLQGAKSLLVVGVLDNSGNIPSTDEDVISDDIFGTDGKDITMKSQLEACSKGAVTLNPFPVGSDTNGVISVMTDDMTNEGLDDIISRAYTFFENAFGFDLRDADTTVFFNLPSAAGNGNIESGPGFDSQSVVFVDDDIYSLSQQIQFFSSIAGVAESRSRDAPDDTGYMGSTFDADDSPLQCFNAVKLVDNGFVTDDEVMYPPVGPSQTDIIGYVDLVASSGDTGVLTLSDDSSQLYVSLNTASGFNVGTGEGANMVQVHEKKSGLPFSILLGTLDVGESYTYFDFGGDESGVDLLISVGAIGEKDGVLTATVTLQYPCSADSVCPAPTGPCAQSTCVNGECVTQPIENCCLDETDCISEDPCTTSGFCVNGPGNTEGVCGGVGPIAGCCRDSNECVAADACTEAGVCDFKNECVAGSRKPGCCITADDCPDPGPCFGASTCMYNECQAGERTEGCCAGDDECLSEDPCIGNGSCEGNQCSAGEPIAGCCRNDGECAATDACTEQGVCDVKNECVAGSPKPDCCITAGDCPDPAPCFGASTCVSNECQAGARLEDCCDAVDGCPAADACTEDGTCTVDNECIPGMAKVDCCLTNADCVGVGECDEDGVCEENVCMVPVENSSKGCKGGKSAKSTKAPKGARGLRKLERFY